MSLLKPDCMQYGCVSETPPTEGSTDSKEWQWNKNVDRTKPEKRREVEIWC